MGSSLPRNARLGIADTQGEVFVDNYSFFSKFRQSFPNELAPHHRPIVAVSGGKDSIALACAIWSLYPAIKDSLIVAHVNHGLRGAEGDLAEDFVSTLSQGFGATFCSRKLDPRKLKSSPDGIESAARTARYDFFVELAKTYGSRYVFTAHHADDQAETILFRILRGTGIKGLRGIPVLSQLTPELTLCRPMLHVSREEIESYLASIEMNWREDSSNSENKFSRNKIRNIVLPKLESMFGTDVSNSIFTLGQIASEHWSLIESLLEPLQSLVVSSGENFVEIDSTGLRTHHPVLITEFLRKVWGDRGFPQQDVSAADWQLLKEWVLLDRPQSRRDFPGGVAASLNSGRLRIDFRLGKPAP